MSEQHFVPTHMAQDTNKFIANGVTQGNGITDAAYDMHNVRISSDEYETLFSITNEKGTTEMTDKDGNDVILAGSYLGHAIIGNDVVVFTTIRKSKKHKKPHPAPEKSCTVEFLINPGARFFRKVSAGSKGGNEYYVFQEIEHGGNSVLISGNVGTEITYKILTNDKSGIIRDVSTYTIVDDAIGENAIDCTVRREYNTGASTSLVDSDKIYLINISDEITLMMLFEGDLNFDVDSPIQTITDYESNNIRKVYWIDGINQIRMIDIARGIRGDASPTVNGEPSTNHFNWQFDFVGTLTGSEIVNITKVDNTGNFKFTPGTVQYVLTYYNKYGAESNPFYISPIMYIAHDDRGGSPEDGIYQTFGISIENINKGYDFVKAYIIHRTSRDTQPMTYTTLPIEISGNDSLYYLDDGGNYQTADYTRLLFPSKALVPKAITSKDATLLVGNFRFEDDSMNVMLDAYINGSDGEHGVKGLVNEIALPSSDEIDVLYTKHHNIRYSDDMMYYFYENQLKYNSQAITGFKYKEHYMFGIQFMNKHGEWSQPFKLGRSRNMSTKPLSNAFGVNVVKAFIDGYHFKNAGFEDLIGTDIIMARPLVIYPQQSEMLCPAQGILNPTIQNKDDAESNSPKYQASWFFRPKVSKFIDIVNRGMSYERVYDKIEKYFMAIVLHKNSSWEGDSGIFKQYSNVFLETDDSLNSQYYANIRFVCSIKTTIGDTSKYILFYNISTLTGKTNSIITNRKYLSVYINDLHTSNVGRIAGWLYMNDVIKSNGELGYSTLYFADKNDVSDDLISSIINGYCDGSNNIYSDPVWDSPKSFVVYSGEYSVSVQSLQIEEDPEPRMTSFGIPFSQNDSRKGKLFPNNYIQAEVQGMYNKFSVKDNVLTFNTPDNFDVENEYYLSCDKYAPIQKTAFDVYVETSTEPLPLFNSGVIPIGFNKINLTHIHNDGLSLYAMPLWFEEFYSDEYNKSSDKARSIFPSAFIVYPFQKTGPLGNQYDNSSIDFRGKLRKKVYSYLRYSRSTVDINETIAGDINMYEYDDSNRIVKFKNGDVYYPNIDKVEFTDNVEEFYDTSISKTKYKIFENMLIYSYNELGSSPCAVHTTDDTPYSVINEKIGNDGKIKGRNSPTLLYEGILDSNEITTEGWGNQQIRNAFYSSKAISMKYKSSGHYVIEGINGNEPFNLNNPNYDGLLIADVVKDYDENKHYFGTQESNMQWMIGGQPVTIQELVDFGLTWTEGDTYYQRWDCLKTMPMSLDDENQIVDICSFFVESRTNLDGRYDRNRGLVDNTIVTENNFNLINDAYTQQNNIFVQMKRDDDIYNSGNLANCISYSICKQPMDQIDQWTKLSGFSNYMVDGSFGDIVKLQKGVDSNIYIFQSNAVGLVLYNSQILQAESGVPLEILNSGKITGIQYITTTVGVRNWYSVGINNDSLIWYDSVSRCVYKIDRNGLQNVSELSLCKSWWYRNSKRAPWCAFDDFRISYDARNFDVYFVNADNAIIYNSNNFIGTFDYEGTPAIFNMPDSNLYALSYNGDSLSLYRMRDSFEYNNFFGKWKPSWITYLCNVDPSTNKMFTNFEYRADMYDMSESEPNDIGTLVSRDVNLIGGKKKYIYTTFDEIEVWNEYQHGRMKLVDNLGRPSNIKEKFRVWRGNIPRDTENNYEYLKRGHNDMISNTWSFIKMLKNFERESHIRFELHDFVVKTL